ncbi:MAG: hypothetical protein U5K71_15050 [Gracilimonas sp.]|nr:hypothetical protein [Gracilimonas sp.]
MNATTMNITQKKSIRSLSIWTGLWVLSTALAAFGPKFIWDSNSTISVIAIGLNFLIGVGMILANIHHLRSLDEMLQRIQLEAMGITLGITLVAGISYSMMDTVNLIAQDAEISFLIILMGLTYLAAIGIGHKRYR